MPLAAKLGLALIPILGIAAGVAFEIGATQHSPNGTLKIMMDACAVPGRQKLETDITRGAVPPIDDFFCLIVPFFKTAVATRLNIGALSILVSLMVPLLTRLTYHAVSPNRKTGLFGGIWIVIIAALGQLAGFGMVASSLGLVIYTFASYLSYKRTSAAVAPVPTAPSSIYLSNLALVLTGLTVIGSVFLDSAGKPWLWTQTAFQFYPLLWLPIALTSLTTPLVNTEKASRDELRTWDAESVSYSFERTWSYYRKYAGLSAIFYWYGLNRIARGLLNEGNKYDDVTHFFLFDIGGTLFTLLSLVVLDRLTVRSKSDRHPLSGATRSQLDIECDKAIARAPAGSPWLEKTWGGFVVASVLAGPGCAAALWWCSGEEEAGWKARKAWREAVAVEGKKVK